MNHETHSIRRFAPLCATAADCDSEIALRRAESRARRTIHEQDKRGFYMSENKIEIRDMNLYYGDFHALHDINLDIKANEILSNVSKASEIGRDWHLNLTIGSQIDSDVMQPMMEKILAGEDVAENVKAASDILDGIIAAQ